MKVESMAREATLSVDKNPSWLDHWASAISRWRYQPEVEGKRDKRIDFLRGFAIFLMVVNHLVGQSYFNEITQQRVYATGAEGFVVLSGLVLGTLSIERAKSGLWAAGRKLVERSLKLYKVNLILLVVVGYVSFVAPRFTRPLFDQPPTSLWGLPIAAATLHLAPPLVDILQLYVLCLLLAPGMLWLLSRGLALPLLAASVGLWTMQQLHPYALSFQPLNRNHVYFAFPSWQLLFVVGFVVGFHRKMLGSLWARIPRRPLFVLLGCAVVAGIVASYQDQVLNTWPSGITDRASWTQLTDRSSQGAIRLAVLVTLFPFLFLLVDTLWKPLDQTLGRILTPLGQNSLYVYLIHIPFVMIWVNLPSSWWQIRILATLGHAVVFAAIWLAVRKQILFNIIPR